MISISLHPLLLKTSKNQFSAPHVPNLHWHIPTSLDSTNFIVESQMLLMEPQGSAKHKLGTPALDEFYFSNW